MKDEILRNLKDPRKLESLYRKDKSGFKNAFVDLYPEIQETITAQFWHERLSERPDEISWGTKPELIVVLVCAFLAGFIAKVPDIFQLDQADFFQRNIGFVFIPLLIAYFAWKLKVKKSKLAVVAGILLACACYSNLLPDTGNKDTFFLASIHLPLFLWTLVGFTFVNAEFGNYKKRLEFLRYNGDLVVMTVVILIAGMLLTWVTLMLFQLIGVEVERILLRYVAVWGLAASPIVATYLVTTNPQLVDKVSPVIAKVFTPMVLIMLVAYLGTVLYTGKNPYSDRGFLLTFNLLLIGVMALIFFSVAENSDYRGNRGGALLLLILSIVTIAVNVVALSAIVFRISEWGITPNRLAVLGSNILFLSNLLLVAWRLLAVINRRATMQQVGEGITYFLPVYSAWTAVVVFVFPALF